MTTQTATRTCEQLLVRSGARRYCSQTVGLQRWHDTSGHEHAACSRHLVSMQSRWTPEPAIPGVYVSVTEADALWPVHTHFDDRDANLADCPACDFVDHPADATVESEYAR